MAPLDRSHNEFLSAFHSNYGAMLYLLRDIASYWSKIAKFLSRISTLTRDIGIAILSVLDVSVSDENGLTYCHSFFHRTVAQSF